MQGKGSGAVNRVELECQVLCASLRQSWVREDKVGAFTSIRELSHLFPDLLPPPEEDRNASNKANYYEVLTVRPQGGLNSIVVGYLRTVRKFLKEYNPKDYRQFYNTILNAGFILRKPRLRLSHDLVVARRWLFESQIAEEEEIAAEPVEEAVPVSAGIREEQPEPASAPSSELPPQQSTEQFEADSESKQAEPAQQPAETTMQAQQQAVESQPVAAPEEEDYDPLAAIEKSWELARITGGYKKPGSDAREAVPPPTIPQSNVPPPTIPQSNVPPPTEPSSIGQTAAAPQTTESPAAAGMEPPPVVLPGAAAPEAISTAPEPPAVQAAAPPSGLPKTPEIRPARSEAEAAAGSAQPVRPAEQASPQSAPASTQASSGQTPEFVFDEKQLRKPEADIDVPAVIRLMEAAHLITKVEMQALKAQMQLAPNIPAERLCLNAGYATQQELMSLRLAQDLLSSGKITMAQFQVAMYDERMSGLRMAESLQVRGWLDTEVRNPVEEFKKNNS